MQPEIEKTLAITPASRAPGRTIDITTVGARTGRLRRIEVWFYRVDGQIYLSTIPHGVAGTRTSCATRRSRSTSNTACADLPAIGTPVRDPQLRAAVSRSIIADLDQPSNPAGIPQPVEPLEEWMAGSPLVRVDSTEGARS